MSMIRKSAATVLAVAVLATSGAFVTSGTANSAPMVRTAQFEAGGVEVIKVGGNHKFGHKKFGHRKHRVRIYGHGYPYNSYGHCFWKSKKVFDPYYGGYYWKKIRVCY